MEMTPEKPSSSKKAWLTGLAIGCGGIAVIVILLFIGGFYFFKNMTRGFKDTEKITTTLVEKYGKVEDFAPDPSGAVAPERIETFLKVRETTAPARKAIEDTLGELVKREKSLAAVRYGIGMVPQMAEYFRARGQALIDRGMGLGEYHYIYAIAYFSWLKKPPEDGPGVNLSSSSSGSWGQDRDRNSVEVRRDAATRNINRTILPMLRNQFGKIPKDAQASKSGPFRDALAAELDAMLGDPHRLPWKDGLPDTIGKSLEPYRDALEAAYSPLTNLFELNFEFRGR